MPQNAFSDGFSGRCGGSDQRRLRMRDYTAAVNIPAQAAPPVEVNHREAWGWTAMVTATTARGLVPIVGAL